MTHPQTAYIDRPSRRSFVECVEPTETWYRYVDVREPFFDPDDPYGELDRAVVGLWKFVVVRHTRRGVWLAAAPVFSWSRQRFVLNDSRKKYAYPTTADAWESFKIRKQRQLERLRSQADHVSAVIRLIERDGQPT